MREFRLVVELKEGECSTADDVASVLRYVANTVSEGEWTHRKGSNGWYQNVYWGVRG